MTGDRLLGAAAFFAGPRVDDTSAGTRVEVAAAGLLPGAPERVAAERTDTEPGATTLTVTLPRTEGSP